MFDSTGPPEAQASLEVICTRTVCPLVKVLVVNWALLVPTGLPFTNHWYTGAFPPLTGVAVKVTGAPLQRVVPKLEPILTDGVSEEPTTTV